MVPDLSPDGSQIVFIPARDGKHEIYRMNSDGSKVMRLTDNKTKEAHPFGLLTTNS